MELGLKAVTGESWTEYGLKFVLKVATKVALNNILPGSGAVVEFGAAAKNLYDGDVNSGVVNILSGISDFFTFGIASAAKNAMKDSGKEAVVKTAKEMGKTVGKEATKNIGKQVGKELAQGVVNEAVEEVISEGTKITAKGMGTSAFLSAVSSGGRDVFKTISEDLGEEWLTLILQKAFSAENAKKFTFEFTKKAAKTAAKEKAKEDAVKQLLKDSFFSAAKGAVNYSRPEDEQCNDPPV